MNMYAPFVLFRPKKS